MPRLKAAKNTQQKKKCTKGFPCGYSCQPQGRNCRKPLEGQAATYHDWLKNKAIAEAKELTAKNADSIAAAKKRADKAIAESQKVLAESKRILGDTENKDTTPQNPDNQIETKILLGANKSVGTKVLRSLQSKKQEERNDQSLLMAANLFGKKGGFDVFKEILEALGNNPNQELSKIVPFRRLTPIDKAAVRQGVRAIRARGKDVQLPTDLLRKLQSLRPEATRIHKESRQSAFVGTSALREKEKAAYVKKKYGILSDFHSQAIAIAT